MIRDNPFFTREVRQLARRATMVQATLLLGFGAMVVILLAWIILRKDDPFAPTLFGPAIFFDSAMRWLLVTSHVVLCGIVAGYGGFRVFAAEHYRSTLEPLRLLPYRPSHWLALKLTFPAFISLVAWLAGVPLYLVAAVCNAIPIGQLPGAMHKPLLAALGVLVASLMFTPRQLDAQKRMKERRAAGRIQLDQASGIWTVTINLYLYLLGMGLLVGHGLASTLRPFYATTIPEYCYWVGVAVTLIPAAWIVAKSVTDADEKDELLKTLVPGLAFTAFYYLALGLFVYMMPPWGRWISLAFFPGFMWAASVAAWRRREERPKPKEDASSQREIEWIGRFIDNPLVTKDLRVYTRNWSLRRVFLWSALAVLGAALSFQAALYWRWAPLPRLLSYLANFMFQLFVLTAFSPWARARMFWYKEWTSGSVLPLLITPLRTTEILGGRMLAVLLYWGPIMAPWVPFTVACLIYFSLAGFWVVAPAAFAALPLIFTVGIWLACMVGKENPFTIKSQFGDWLAVALRFAQIVAVVVWGAFVIAGIDAATSPSLLMPWVAWPLAFALFAVNCSLAAGWFWQRVRALDRYRRGDMQLPDSKVMDRQPLPALQTSKVSW